MVPRRIFARVKEKLNPDIMILIRQGSATLVSSSLSVVSSFTYGFTGVVLPLLKEDPDFPYNEEIGSWIASIAALAMAVGCLVSGIILDRLGRRAAHICLTVPSLVGWILIAFARDTPVILLGRAFTGFSSGAMRPVTMVYLGEITDPKYRGITLMCPAIGVSIGLLGCQLISMKFPWRISSLLLTAPIIIVFVMSLFMKESPLWLIYKNRRDDGGDMFRWFRGTSEAAVTELESAIERQKEISPTMAWKEMLAKMMEKCFWEPFLTVFIIFSMVQFCGLTCLLFYADDLFNSTFHGEIETNVLIIMLDFLKLLGTFLICIVGKWLPKRGSLLFSSFGTTAALIILFINLEMKFGVVWVKFLAILFFMLFSSIMTSIAWAFLGELFPLSIRGLGCGISSAVNFILLFSALKIIPSFRSQYGTANMYLLHASVTGFCSVLLCFILPNTDGKSLQEIEDNYMKEET